jgi:hypothetical protein
VHVLYAADGFDGAGAESRRRRRRSRLQATFFYGGRGSNRRFEAHFAGDHNGLFELDHQRCSFVDPRPNAARLMACHLPHASCLMDVRVSRVRYGIPFCLTFLRHVLMYLLSFCYSLTFVVCGYLTVY